MVLPSVRAKLGVNVLLGRFPGVSDAGNPCSSQNICALVPRQNPNPGMAGELCNHPPEGVAEIMFPHRSTTSMWQVSPDVVPYLETVGSPKPPIRTSGAGGAWFSVT